MQTPPKIGSTHETCFTVEKSHTIEFSEHGIPAVLATPWLIWFLEHAALDLVKPHLDQGELTVGVQVEMEHLAPAPLGSQVICRVRVVHVEGPVITFQIEAVDPQGPIAKGLHKRRAVRAERIAALVRKKIDE
jgi:fluoroacetyl-CoA thioesterase